MKQVSKPKKLRSKLSGESKIIKLHDTHQLELSTRISSNQINKTFIKYVLKIVLSKNTNKYNIYVMMY